MFNQYTELGRKYDLIRFWMQLIGQSNKEVFCECKSKLKTKKLNPLCLSLASLTPNKTIITSTKEIYLTQHSKKIKKEGIRLYDGDEAKSLLNTRTIIINQTTTGRKSSIINNIND